MKWLWTSGTADHWLGWEQCFMWTTKFDQVDSCSSNLVLDEKIVCEKTLIYWWVWFPGFKVPFISWRETWHKKTKKIAYIALLQLNLSWNIWSVWDDCCNSRKYLMSFCFYGWTWCPFVFMSERGVSLRVMFVHAGRRTQDSWCWHAHSVPGAHKCATRGCIIITYLCTKHSKVAFEIPKFTCSGQSGGATPWASSLCP